MTSAPVPRVSVIIPTRNGTALLAECLQSLEQQIYRDFEAIVVDDASTDATGALLRDKAWVQVVRLPGERGHGFVAACNKGLTLSKGAIVVLLNNDTVPEASWLGELVSALDRNPWASMAASKLLLYDRPDLIHSAGDYYGLDGVPNSRGVWQQDGAEYNREEEVFGPTAAAAAYRREMLLDLAHCGGTQPGGRVLDPQLWMYCEDVDLNLRARLRGYRTVYVPTARVRHRLSATGGGVLASYHVARNLIYLIAKDLPFAFVVCHFPAIARAQLRSAFAALMQIKGAAARATLRGMLVGLLTWPRVLPSRARVAATRRITPAQFEMIVQSFTPERD